MAGTNRDKDQTQGQGTREVSLQGPQFTLQNEEGGAAGATQMGTRVHPSIHDTIGGCASFFVVTACAYVRTDPLSVEVKIKILDITVADFVLDVQHPSISIDVSLLGYGLTGSIQLVDECKVTADLKLTIPFHEPITWKGDIINWCPPPPLQT